ncbi:hypothetical protein LDENG_00211630 [Lucifuga dentata]|nr:hypothetical protein LDENG_00211630 [Lucifuga dentata]
MQRLQEQHHLAEEAGSGKLPTSASSSSGVLHGSANTTSSRLSTLPQAENMAPAFSEAPGSKGSYMDVRMGEAAGEGGPAGGGGAVDVRGGPCNEATEDSDDDGGGSASEISTIAKEVDKVNQIINNCIDALKLDAANVITAETPPPLPPACITPLPRNLLLLSPARPAGHIMASSPKVHPKLHPQPHPQPHLQSHPQPHLQPHPQPHPQFHPQLHQQPHPASMAPVPLVVPLSERPGISGGGFLSPPYRDPPPANAPRPLRRQLSADTAVVKNRCASSGGSVKSVRVLSVENPEKHCNDTSKYAMETGSPVGGGGGGGGCNGSGMGTINGGGVSVNGGGVGCSNGGAAGGGQQHLEVQDFHGAEHRHSFPALCYQGANDPLSPAQKASFLKPLGCSKDATAAYAQLSPSRHHSYNSGYSSSPEYSSESMLRIWERFRPYRKSPREGAAYIAAGHALRKKVQFAKDEDLHDILDYWKGVSAQQKL